MLTKTMILGMADKIKVRFAPQKIILFGSYAWGEPDDDSDVDLFIIMDSDLRKDQRGRWIQAIFADRTFPLDIIVYTPEEVRQSLARGNPFIAEILTKGGVLYG